MLVEKVGLERRGGSVAGAFAETRGMPCRQTAQRRQRKRMEIGKKVAAASACRALTHTVARRNAYGAKPKTGNGSALRCDDY